MALKFFGDKVRKLLLPLIASLAIASALYSGGSAYQTVGIQAFDTTRQILAYALGIAEILFLAVFVRRVVQFLLLDGLLASALGTPVPRLLSQLSGLIIYLLAIAAVIGIVFQQDLTVLWAASGVIGFVFGIALRDMILDIFTGLAINLDRPVKIGDNVLLQRAGEQVVEGKVLEISWRTTRIENLFGNIIIVPNSKLASSTITNYSSPKSFFGVPIVITLDAEIPPDRAIRVLQAAATEGVAGFTLPDAPAPAVLVKDIGAVGVEYVIVFCPTLETRFRGRSSVLFHALIHLAKAGIRPAWPKLERTQADRTTTSDGSGPEPHHLALLLGATELFRDLNEAELNLLSEGAQVRPLSLGAILTQGGEGATAITLVIEGLFVQEGRRAGPGGATAATPQQPGLVGPGALVGGEALLTGDAHACTLRAKTAALVAELDLALIRRLLAQRPPLAEILSRRLASIIHRQTRAAGSGRRLLLGETELAADIQASLRRTFADLRLV
ncbi:Small-conductance mechanosensitive channel [uncultured Gammaproteobacteria bacterium]